MAVNKTGFQNHGMKWRPRPELNWCTRFCRPLRNHSATWPHKAELIYALLYMGNQGPVAIRRVFFTPSMRIRCGTVSRLKTVPAQPRLRRR